LAICLCALVMPAVGKAVEYRTSQGLKLMTSEEAARNFGGQCVIGWNQTTVVTKCTAVGQADTCDDAPGGTCGSAQCAYNCATNFTVAIAGTGTSWTTTNVTCNTTQVPCISGRLWGCRCSGTPVAVNCLGNSFWNYTLGCSNRP
jgi:hypothetical protein